MITFSKFQLSFAAVSAALCMLATGAQAQSVSANQSSSVSFSAPGGLVITPKNGQSTQQQSADRFECHTWAMNQTGYDPTSSSAGSTAQKPKLAPYRRAMSACLEAKGYAVSAPQPPSYVAPPPPVLPAPTLPTAPPAAAPVVPATVYHGPSAVRVVPVEPALDYHPFRAQIAAGYDVPTGQTHGTLDGDLTASLGFAWFPAAALPLGVRVDGSYDWFRFKDSYAQESGARWGHEHVYGGDVDLQLDLAHQSTRSKAYLLGGVGWYRMNSELVSFTAVDGCGYYHCGPGYVPTVTNTTSPWRQSWNAGLGWEIALPDRTSFFVEARYERIRPYSGGMSFVPVTLGLRF